MAMNRKLVCTAKSTFEQRLDPIPCAPSTGVIVKVCYAAICHSDLHLYQQPERLPPDFLPRVLGHEISGVVHSVGEQYAKEPGCLAVGALVVTFQCGGCQQCVTCRAGDYLHCSQQEGCEKVGFWVDGGFQQYLTVLDPWRLTALPKDSDPAVSSMAACRGMTAYHAIELCRGNIERAIQIKGRADVVVYGCGALGLWTTEILKAVYGHRVRLCVLDILEEKLRGGSDKGADHVICLSGAVCTEGAVEGILSAFDEQYADAAIDLVSTASTQDALLQCLANGGILVVAGFFPSAQPSFDCLRLVLWNHRIQGCCGGSKEHLQAVLDLIAQGKISGPPMTFIRFKDIEKTFRKLAQGFTHTGCYVAEIAKSSF